MATSYLSRRGFIASASGLALSPSLAHSRSSASVDVAPELFTENDHTFLNALKLLGSLESESVYVSFSGTLTAVVPDTEPRPICGFQGLARTDWRHHGSGRVSKHSFDIGFFSDLDTGRPIDEVLNPVTNKRVEPLHFKYGGGESKEIKPSNFMGQYSWSTLADQVWLHERAGGDFEHPLPAEEWPKASSGKRLLYRSESDYSTDISTLKNPNVSNAQYTLFWSSLLSWEPWLLMGQQAGFSLWRGVGRKLKSIDDVPLVMREYIEQHQANYFGQSPPWQDQIGSFNRYQTLRKPHSS